MAKTRPATMVQHLPALWVESVANSSIQEVEGTADEGIHLRTSGIDSIFLLVDFFLTTPYTISNKNYYYTLMVYQGGIKGTAALYYTCFSKTKFYLVIILKFFKTPAQVLSSKEYINF